MRERGQRLIDLAQRVGKYPRVNDYCLFLCLIDHRILLIGVFIVQVELPKTHYLTSYLYLARYCFMYTNLRIY